MPGRLIVRTGPSASAPTRPACTRLAVVAAGEATHSGVSSGTGHTLSTPARGSRTIPLTKLDIAELGWPGRTDTVGTRHTTASITPRRDASSTSNSAIALVVPYVDWGRSAWSSGTTSGSGPPNTAMVLAKTKRGGRASRRHPSSRACVPPTFTAIARSGSASD